MMIFSRRLSLSILAFIPMACPRLAEDLMLVVPGKSVGPIEAGTSEADLAAQLPPGQVKRVLFSLGEGAAGCGTEVFSGTPDAVVVSWSNANVEYELGTEAALAACRERQGLARPASVRLENPAGHWHTADGIKIGMTVSALARLGGEPISMSVCPCDFGGFVDTPDSLFGDKLEIWASSPQNADYTYASVIDTTADYMLSSEDIGVDAESGFPIYRMVVAIGD